MENSFEEKIKELNAQKENISNSILGVLSVVEELNNLDDEQSELVNKQMKNKFGVDNVFAELDRLKAQIVKEANKTDL